VTLLVKVTVGGASVLPYLQACLSPGSHGDVTTSQKSTSGVLCLTKCIECNAFDQGLFSVSSKKVQLTDASEFTDYTHANGPRHIPSKANTPSSNHRGLISVIPRTKYASGSTQPRENKHRTSKKKRLKQQKCLLSIVPSHSHSIPDLLPDKFYTHMMMVVTLAIPGLIIHHLEPSQTGYYLSGIHTFMSFVITFHILTKDSFIDLPINQVISY
jgi:hypothetical protein